MLKLCKKFVTSKKGATRFSDLDLSHGFHQVPLHKDSRHINTFQTHKELQFFKVLFFGGSPASTIFHDRIRSALRGCSGFISIHDNNLLYGKLSEEHGANLEACLQQLVERGVISNYKSTSTTHNRRGKKLLTSMAVQYEICFPVQ